MSRTTLDRTKHCETVQESIFSSKDCLKGTDRPRQEKRWHYRVFKFVATRLEHTTCYICTHAGQLRVRRQPVDRSFPQHTYSIRTNKFGGRYSSKRIRFSNCNSFTSAQFGRFRSSISGHQSGVSIIPATSPQCFAVTSVRLIDKKAWSRRSCSSTGSTRSRKCSSSTGQDRQSPTRSSQYRAAIPSSALSTSNWRRPRQRCLRQEAASSGSTSDPQSAEQRHHQPATARNN